MIDEIFTISEIAARAKITRQAALARLKAFERAGKGPFVKRGNVYLLTREQAEKLCLGVGRGWDAIKYHANERSKPVASIPRRRKAS